MLKKINNFLTKNRVVSIFLVLIILSGITGYIIDKNKQRVPVVEKTSKDQTTEGIRPGKTTDSDLEKLQNLRLKKDNPDGTITYFFGAQNDPKPMEVIVNKGLVIFIKKRPNEGEPTFIKEATVKYGEPDFTLFANISGSVAYVFLDEGLAAIADKDSGVVHELRYFIPTTKEAFLETWGKDLSEESPSPPPLYY